MQKQESLPLGVVLERRRIDNPWKEFAWRPVAVVPGAPACDPRADWRVLDEGEDWVRYLGGTLPLELFRGETEAYKVTLSQNPPRLFVVLRAGADLDCGHDVVPFLVTASAFEAQDSLDSGEDIVETVVMPPDVVAFVQAFVDRHHVEHPVHKRQRKGADAEAGFARRPRRSERERGHG